MNKKELEAELKKLNEEVEKEIDARDVHQYALQEFDEQKRELKTKLYNEYVKDIKVGDYIIYEDFMGDKIEYGKVLEIDVKEHRLRTLTVSEHSYSFNDWDFFIRKATNKEMIDRMDGKIIKR